MTPKSQEKIKPQFPQYPFLTILTLKKYHANKYTILSFNCIMRIYGNVYDCAIYTLNYYELFGHFKHTVKLYYHCMYTQIIKKM